MNASSMLLDLIRFRMMIPLLAVVGRWELLGNRKIKAEDRPNLMFILADGFGYRYLACYGRKDIRTPNLDELARQGVRFTSTNR